MLCWNRHWLPRCGAGMRRQVQAPLQVAQLAVLLLYQYLSLQFSSNVPLEQVNKHRRRWHSLQYYFYTSICTFVLLYYFLYLQCTSNVPVKQVNKHRSRCGIACITATVLVHCLLLHCMLLAKPLCWTKLLRCYLNLSATLLTATLHATSQASVLN
jgi:hypothetical protein